jgi:enoyl-[acyl-carrier protein] reductase II
MALRTRLCGLLGIEVPVIQAGMSIYTSAELAAAVSNAGGLGSLGVWQRSLDDLEHSLRTLNALTDRPFALNHVVPDLDEEAFDRCLRASPAVMAFALDDAGRSLVERVHDAGGLAMQQLSTVAQAERAADNGVDLIVAQGSESGGYAGVEVSTLALLPQVVDAVAPVPVIAAGGIGDGRGVAAALVLGAAGVNLGTRFLATRESAVSEVFRRHIVQSASGDWQQVEWQNEVRPNPGTVGYGTKLRLLVNDFCRRCEEQFRSGTLDVEQVRTDLLHAAMEGRLDELFVSAGQSAGLVRDVPSAGDVVRMLAEETEAALTGVQALLQ